MRGGGHRGVGGHSLHQISVEHGAWNMGAWMLLAWSSARDFCSPTGSFWCHNDIERNVGEVEQVDVVMLCNPAVSPGKQVWDEHDYLRIRGSKIFYPRLHRTCENRDRHTSHVTRHSSTLHSPLSHFHSTCSRSSSTSRETYGSDLIPKWNHPWRLHP